MDAWRPTSPIPLTGWMEHNQFHPLLAAFMAGMAANVSAFNTVFSVDLWERYAVKDRSDGYYLRVGRWATVGATVDRVPVDLDVLAG